MHMNISYINMCKLKKNREWRKELEKERERLVVMVCVVYCYFKFIDHFIYRVCKYNMKLVVLLIQFGKTHGKGAIICMTI